MIDKVKQGKKNRSSGSDFERRTRIDLENKGYIASKFQSNVGVLCPKCNKQIKKYNKDYICKTCGIINNQDIIIDGIIPAKASRFRLATTGFPDYIAFKIIEENKKLYDIIGVECKVNGYLSSEEKLKCKYLLENNIFSKILIAYKEKFKNKILVKYKDFLEYTKHNKKNEK